MRRLHRAERHAVRRQRRAVKAGAARQQQAVKAGAARQQQAVRAGAANRLQARRHRAAGRAPAVLLAAEDIDAQALALGAALGLDWTQAPFTRCMVDNTPLRPADAAELARIPEGARALPGPFRACPACGRLFWPGSHVRRMLARLEGWKAGPGAGAAETVFKAPKTH